ncbi:hypothetical protein GA0115252_16369 [Streptomyces sp. DfronAA-171]|nr:hypothetical protein GA0115252_16369 [Streptomyces sp. DfronAA-171]
MPRVQLTGDTLHGVRAHGVRALRVRTRARPAPVPRPAPLLRRTRVPHHHRHVLLHPFPCPQHPDRRERPRADDGEQGRPGGAGAGQLGELPPRPGVPGRFGGAPALRCRAREPPEHRFERAAEQQLRVRVVPGARLEDELPHRPRDRLAEGLHEDRRAPLVEVRAEDPAAPAQPDAREAVVQAPPLVAHHPAVRQSAQRGAQREREAARGRGDELEGAVAVGRVPQGVGEPRTERDDGPVLHDDQGARREHVHGGDAGVGHGHRRDVGTERDDVGRDGAAGPHGAAEDGREPPGEGAGERVRLGHRRRGARLGPPHGALGVDAEQSAHLGGHPYERGRLDRDERAAVRGAELRDGALRRGVHAEVGAAREEAREERRAVGRRGGQHDDVAGHGAGFPARASWTRRGRCPRRTSMPRPGGWWLAWTPGKSWPSARSPSMTSAVAPVSRSAVSSGS